MKEKMFKYSLHLQIKIIAPMKIWKASKIDKMSRYHNPLQVYANKLSIQWA